MIGIGRSILGERNGNCSTRHFVQPKGSLVEDHTHFVEDGMRWTILVHPPMGSPMHLEGNRGLVNFSNLMFAVATVAASLASDATCLLGVGVVVGNHVVEILPLVGMVGFAVVVFVEAVHQSWRVGFADKWVSMENIETAFLMQTLDVDVRHDVVALRFGDGQPGLHRSGDTGIVDTGTSFPKWTFEKNRTTNRLVENQRIRLNDRRVKLTRTPWLRAKNRA